MRATDGAPFSGHGEAHTRFSDGMDAAGASAALRPNGLSACISARQGGGYRCNPLRGGGLSV